MSELICLELSVIWWVVHVLCQAVTARGEFGDAFLFSPRDANVTAKGLVCGRATRALRNYVENLVPFVALDLALIVTQHAGGLGATLWIIGRVIYLPIYLAGIPYIRTAAWLLSIVGLLMMLGRLMGY
ncbi:MAG: MAPEG family protein [Xanthobacteraceae bacterium]